MMQDIYEKIYSVFWIDYSGISRIQWYNPNQAILRKDKDDLISGFISALMSFSKEVFGSQIANVDIKDFKIFFSILPSKDILALVTKTNLEPGIVSKILQKIEFSLGEFHEFKNACEQIPEEKYGPLIDKVIRSAIPQSFEEFFIQALDLLNFDNDNAFYGYLILDNNGAIIKKHHKNDIDFEISSFLESVFWEKMVLPYFEMMPMFNNTFNINTNPNLIIKSKGVNFALLFMDQRIISLAFSGDIKETRINQIIEEIQKN